MSGRRAVLKTLSPESGSSIKGSRQSYQKLLSVSGYEQRPRDFEDLILMLDQELRLITPAAMAEDEQVAESADSSESVRQDDAQLRYYQLTHDYLVPSLRDWLTRKQRETRRGRAELRLAERAEMWHARPQRRYLPSLTEYVTIRSLTRPGNWSSTQRAMMRRAGWHHLVRVGLFAVAVSVIAAAGVIVRNNVIRQHNLTRAEGLVSTLANADTAQVPAIVERLAAQAQLVAPLIEQRLATSKEGSGEKLNLLLALDDLNDQQLDYLCAELLESDAEHFPVIRDVVARYPDRARTQLWAELTSQHDDRRQRRLRAAGALAAFDPDDRRWVDVAQDIAQELVSVNPSTIGVWQGALRPISQHLVAELTRVFGDRAQDELARSLATSVLCEYARNDVATLADLVTRADTRAFEQLLPVLEAHGTAAITQLEALVQPPERPVWEWPVPSTNSGDQWTDVTSQANASIAAAHGMVSDAFAFCQDLKWDQVGELLASLGASGYRPIRVRPYHDGQGIHAAVVWTRDGGAWRFDEQLTAEEVAQKIEAIHEDSLLPSDVAAYYVDGNVQPEQLRYSLLWAPAVTNERRQITIGQRDEELQQQTAAMADMGFGPVALQALSGPQGVRYYSCVWSNAGAGVVAGTAYGGWERLDMAQIDVSVADTDPLPDPLLSYRMQLELIEGLPSSAPESPRLLRLVGVARYYLGQLDAALAALDRVTELEKLPTRQVAWVRALTLARLGRAADARTACDRCLATLDSEFERQCLDVQVAAWLGELDEADRLFDSMELDALDAEQLYLLASTAAQASLAAVDQDAERSKRWQERALDQLTRALAAGFQGAERITNDADMLPLHSDRRFSDLLEQLPDAERWAALWSAQPLLESHLVSGRGLADQLVESRRLAVDGFRPAAWAVTLVGKPPRVTAASVWHRPGVPEDDQEQRAIAQANAAVALLRLQRADPVWPLLRHQADPRARSYLLDRLASLSVEPDCLIQQLAVQPDVAIRRAIVLGLGKLAQAGRIAGRPAEQLGSELLRLYYTDPDPGMHGATAWTLRALGKDEELAVCSTRLADGQPSAERDWYVTVCNEHTMVVLHPSEFLMGTPLDESAHNETPSALSAVHRRRIDRAFALSMHEVTVEQFLAFRPQHRMNRDISREDNSPAHSVTWYWPRSTAIG